MKILVTGFEPFGGDKVNPSSMAVGLLPEQIHGADIIKKELPVVFGEAADQLTEMIRDLLPDAVICTGLAAGRRGITPELIAVNIRDARIPDNAGGQPEWENIVPGGADGLFSTLPIREMTEALNAAGISAEISKSAGTYVCNEVMYRLLAFCRKEYPGMKAGFIHLPCAAEYLPERREQKDLPALPLAQIKQALEICIRETVIRVNAKNVSPTMIGRETPQKENPPITQTRQETPQGKKLPVTQARQDTSQGKKHPVTLVRQDTSQGKKHPVTLVRQDISQAEKIYEEHLIWDFPEDEVKPFSVIEAAMKEGHYLVYAAMLDGEMAGYIILETGERQGKKIALLDYFSVVPGKRDQGIGSRIMKAFSPEKTGFDYILVESERVTEDLEEEQKKERLRRISFYERAGAKKSGVYTYLYGVFYDIMILTGGEETGKQEVFALTDYMYREMYPAYWFPKLASIFTE